MLNKRSNRQPFLASDNPVKFLAPPGFSEITYEIRNDVFIPVVRKDQQQPDFSQNAKNTNYKFPVHKPTNPSYNLLCTLDKMKVGDHIQVKDRDMFNYAYSQASVYAASLRRDKKHNITFRFRGAYDVALNIGRIWRIA
jgi:hypothetical protein